MQIETEMKKNNNYSILLKFITIPSRRRCKTAYTIALHIIILMIIINIIVISLRKWSTGRG